MDTTNLNYRDDCGIRNNNGYYRELSSCKRANSDYSGNNYHTNMGAR